MRTDPSSKKPIRRRFSDFIWEEQGDRPFWLDWLARELRVAYFVFKGFQQHQCMLRASALTYVTLLSIVPVLALVISFIKGFGIDTRLLIAPEKAAAVSVHEDNPSTASRPSDSGARATTPGLATEIVDRPTTLPGATEAETEAGREEAEPWIAQPGDERVNFVERFRDWLTALLTAGQSEVWNQIVRYAENTDFSALQALGILVLIVTAIMALSTMEHVFNEIWHVRRARPFVQKFAYYLSVILICPLLMAAAMFMSATLRTNTILERIHGVGFLDEAVSVIFRLLPYAFLWISLGLLYLFLPNTKVRIRAAMAGGFVAGVIWQLGFWVFTTFQIGVARYNAIYSTFAAVPIWLTWLYVSWVIVLIGAEVAAAAQYRLLYERNRAVSAISNSERLQVGLNLVLVVCNRFLKEQPAWDAPRLSQYLQCSEETVDGIVDSLTVARILMPTGNGDYPAYQPAVPLDHISPARVIEALQDSNGSGGVGNATPESISAHHLMEKWREALWRELGEIGIDDLVEQMQHPEDDAEEAGTREHS